VLQAHERLLAAVNESKTITEWLAVLQAC
jgi:hypothetical protein